MTENTAGATAPVETRHLEIGDTLVALERVSARKASAAFAILRSIGADAPELITAWGEFQADYEASHVVELDRSQAFLRYGPRPLLDAGEPVRYPDTIEVNGQAEAHPRAGELVLAPSPLDAMSEEDWRASDNKLRLPRSPSWGETAAAVFPQALDVAEEHVYRLLALFVTPNDEVKRARRNEGGLKTLLDERVETLLDDAYGDELLELAVTCGELVDAQFMGKARQLGDRLGNALRLLGLDPDLLKAQQAPQEPQTPPSGEETPTASTSPETSSETPSSSRPTSASDTDAPSADGIPTPSSAPTGPSSEPLVGASTSSKDD